MKIIIVGYGKMGKAVERLAPTKGHQIAGIVRSADEPWPEGDVAIEFTQPDACLQNFRKAMDHNIPLVTGTTGWMDQREAIKKEVTLGEHSFLYASNFSIGVNIFFKLNEYLAKMMAPYQDYDLSIEEIHHLEKKDAPSGTAITMAEDIIRQSPIKSQWINRATEDKNTVSIVSLREEKVPGTHQVTYSNTIDSLSIKHVAKNREGFALGSIFAAEWLLDKKGFFSMKDLFE